MAQDHMGNFSDTAFIGASDDISKPLSELFHGSGNMAFRSVQTGIYQLEQIGYRHVARFRLRGYVILLSALP